jgi:intein/homing endonuclease
MGKIITKNRPCLKCSSHDARQIYEDGTSFCFSCKKFFPAQEGEDLTQYTSPSPPQKKISIDDIASYPVRGFKSREIPKVICEFYGVKVSYGEDGEIATHYYPYEGGKAYKIRQLPKEFTWVNKSTKLFGRELFNGGGKRLIIAEGEIDTLSLAWASYNRYKKVYPTVGLSSSVMTKSLLEERDWIRSFQEVVLCFDEDEAGEKARLEAIRIIGIDKVRIAKFSLNDANDVLREGGPDKLLQNVFDAAKYIPAGIIGKEDLWKALVEYNNTPSVPYPDCIGGFNSKAKGARLGEIALFVSGTSCLGLGTPVLMYDGSIKNIEDIIVGDIVMGDDSTPRNVLSLARGVEQLYKISLGDGTSFVCNASHIHSVVNNDSEGRWGLTKNQVVDVKVSEYLKWSDKRKHLSKSFKANLLEFNVNPKLYIHPYILGAWLGDGYSDSARISASDVSIEILSKFNTLNQDVIKHETEFSWGLPGLSDKLRYYDLLKNKHIPEDYLISSSEDRMELLAGLIDTDGCALSDGRYEFSQKSESLTDQITRLARSLGFKVSKSKQSNNKFGNCFRLWISGPHISDIPVAISYKKIPFKVYRTDQRRFNTEIEKLDVGNFYGFELDGNQRFVLGNFTVTHNCGKSTIMREIMLSLAENTPDKIGVVSLEESPAETARKLAGMMLHRNPSKDEIPLEELKEGFDKVFDSDRFMLLDHQGSLKDETILDKLEYMALSGAKYIIIDHITILVSEGAGTLTGNEAIDKVMNDLLRFVKRYNVWIGLVSHLRKTVNTGKSFEEGEMPNLDDIKGCLAYNTEVLLSTGRPIAVQDIQVGDTLLSDNGEKTVLSLCRGEQQMYRITTKTTNDSFVCNEDHVLTLSHNDVIFDIKLSDFLNKSESFRYHCKQHYSTGYELPERPLLIPPYALGVWLGDGSKSAFRVMDAGRLGIAERVAVELNATLKAPNDVNREYFNFDTGSFGDMLHRLKSLNLYCKKHIPDDYIFNTKKNRLELLAGLLDSDGYYNSNDNAYYFYQKDEVMANAVKKIARSLGLYSNVRSQIINGNYSSNGTVIFVVTVSGNIEEIPSQKSIKLTHNPRSTNPLKRGIIVEKLDVQPYYGFTLDGDGRFLLENHTITHNSGSIKQVSFDIFAFARNLQDPDEIKRNTIKAAVLKCRFTGLTGPVSGAYYDYDTGRFKAVEDSNDFTKQIKTTMSVGPHTAEPIDTDPNF